MRSIKVIVLVIASITIWQCNPPKQNEIASANEEIASDSVVFSFAFLGCNRIDWADVTDSIPSTANKGVLERIFKEMSNLKDRPELFFFLGDLVLAETDTAKLNTQLGAWVKLYTENEFSQSGIELVAVPGNHEMLFSKETKAPDGKSEYKEYPLRFSTQIWLEHMKEYMPKDREVITGSDSLINTMTFSFMRNNVGFIVMNTDTYNPPTTENPYGLEGQIPTQWILDKISEYKSDIDIDHIFVLGHRPYYVDGVPETGHTGLPEGPVLWAAMTKYKVPAMLSAHVHDYQRMQPNGEGTYQVIAGNGGSKGTATFFGYTTINILSNGEIQLIAKGFDVANPYNVVSDGPTTVRDSTILTWTKNANPYQR